MPALPPPDPSLPAIEQLRAVVAALRSPEGCPWDREQSHATLRGGLLEEAYEVVAAIDASDDLNFCEELGDLLLQVVFHGQIAAEEGRFTFDQIALGISQKLVRRHPHVFGSESADDSAAVLVRWEEIKRQEKGAQEVMSALDGISEGMPALQYAAKVQKRAARIGFDWQEASPVLEKIREELSEVEGAVNEGAERLEEELGDLLFAVVNLTRKLNLDPEVALSRATRKFARRFRALEGLLRARSLPESGATLDALDLLWEEVKAEEKRAKGESSTASSLQVKLGS
ncbi:MAG: nucleoside triphosphate pyrophosphohydrolase [Verrucomicrobia bacterium]|nr:nucleoside triphosphate pyrophosphohydrolase [Verrucomicrobiota bacterium]